MIQVTAMSGKFSGRHFCKVVQKPSEVKLTSAQCLLSSYPIENLKRNISNTYLC